MSKIITFDSPPKFPTEPTVSAKEAWDTPIISQGLKKRQIRYNDSKIPILATSYDQPKQLTLFKRIRRMFKRRIQQRVIKPILRRETVSNVVWRSDFESSAAFLALAFSACTLFRFPFVCVRFGGGLFFAVYALIIIFVMQPVMFTSMILGRVSRTGLAKYPVFYLFSKGIPLIMLYMTMVFVTSNNVVLGYSGVYVLAQLLDTSPDTCTRRMKRHANCTSYKDVNPVLTGTKGVTLSEGNFLSTDLFFRYYIQGDRWKQGRWFFFSPREWRFFIGIIFVFSIILLAIYKNIVSTFSRVLIYGTLLLPLCIAGLTIFQIVFEGGVIGLSFQLIGLKYSYLLTVEFWSEAWGFALCSCYPGYGVLSSFGHYKTSVKGVYLLTWMVCFAVIIFSALSMSVVATEMGILENMADIRSYFDVISEQAALSYVCLTNVLMKVAFQTTLEWPSIGFFGFVTIFGLWIQVVATEVCINYVLEICNEYYPSLALTQSNRVQVALGILVVELLLLIAYGTQAGPFMFEAHFIFGGSWAACLIAIIRIYTATRWYGFDIFHVKVELLLTQAPPRWYEIQMRYIVLPLLGAGFLCLTLGMFFLEYLPHQVSHDPPPGSLIYGWILNIIPVAMLLWYILHLTGCKRNKIAPANYVSLAEKVHADDNLKTARRLQDRRGAIFLATDLSQPDKFVAVKKRIALQEEAQAIHKIQTLQKKELEDLVKKKKYQLAWQNVVSKAVRSAGVVKTFPNAVKYFNRRHYADNLRKDATYLTTFLKTYSVENIFAAATTVHTADDGVHFELVSNSLLHDPDLEQTLPSRIQSQNKFIPKIVNSPVQKTLPKMYAEHIDQDLGEPYSDSEKCDWKCTDDNEEEITLSDASPEPKEYVVKYSVKDQNERVIHILVVEGRSHPIMMKLPKPEPPMTTINYKILESKTDKEKFRLITGKMLLYLHKYHKHFFTDVPRTVTKEDLKTNKYKDLITNHIDAESYGFLDPNKVCIAVIEKKEDAEYSQLESQFVNPLEGRGWLLKPTRRKLREEKRIEFIEDVIETVKPPPGQNLITLKEIIDENALTALRDKLIATPADIVFKNNDDENDAEPIYMDDANSDSSDDSIFDVLRPKPSDVDRFLESPHELQSAHNLAIKAEDDEEFHHFLAFLGNWKNPERDLRYHMHKPGLNKLDGESGTGLGRRQPSESVLANMDSQKADLFPIGTLPMQIIRDGPSPPNLELSELRLPNIKFKKAVQRIVHLTTGHTKSAASVATLWSQLPFDSLSNVPSVASLYHTSLPKRIADRGKDTNTNDRYIYTDIGSRRLEITRMDEDNIIFASSRDSIGTPPRVRSIFGLFKSIKS